MKKISREDFLGRLQLVEPGLSPAPTYEQSNCFVFKGGEIITFNNEVSCRCESGIEEKVDVAIPAKPLLAMLQKRSEEYLEVAFHDGVMLISGKEGKTTIKTEKKLHLLELLTEHMEEPDDWSELPEDFGEALSLVQECTSNDSTKFKLTCVHIHPKWVEAADNFRGTRYRMKSGIKAPTLVRRNAIKHIVSMGMVEVAETENWVHFRNTSGLIYSCRRYMDVGEYHDLHAFYQVEGEKIVLPKGLADAAARAEIFSAEDEDNNIVKVELRPGKLRITGTGITGNHVEVKKVSYKGRPLTFVVFPKLLAELLKRHTECIVSEEKLMIDGGKWRYVTILNKIEDMKTPKGLGDEEE